MKIKNIIIVILLIVAVFFILMPSFDWLFIPELTQMQQFLKWWWSYAIGIVCAFIVILLNSKDQTH